MITALPSATDFDPRAALPTGTTVIEASAGTGKTFAIAAIATRLLADGDTSIDRILLATFARSASLELRSRVHARLEGSLQALRAVLSGAELARQDADDAVLTELCTADHRVLGQRADRLEQALGEFDRATIATTHEFCSGLLEELGVLVDHDPGVLSERAMADLRRQVVDDVLLTRVMQSRRVPGQTEAREVGEAALRHRGLPLLDPPGGDETARARVQFAEAVRREFAARIRRLRLYGFDDMVQRVVNALLDPVTGERAAQTLAGRYDLVMVDEFQDTDPAQWTILRRAFHHRTRLVVVGDPKQAIYAFRGADVQAYLDATREADHRFTLSCNHRCDPGVAQGIAELFGHAGMGSGGQDIRLTKVTTEHQQARLRFGSATPRPAVQLRAISPDRILGAAEARAAICADLVREFDTLLARCEVLDGDRWRGLRADDLAVLVRRRATGQQIQQALVSAGIPAVFTGGEGIFASRAAAAWLDLLDAALDPRMPLLARLALDPLVGWAPDRLAHASEADRDELMALAKLVRTSLREQGPTAAFELLSQRTDLVPRLLARLGDGQRLVTDLRHLTERLEEAARTDRLDMVALREWLFEQMQGSGAQQDDDAVRRLDTEHRAVTVMTIHKAKGLQFPVVALPDMASRFAFDSPGSRRRRTLMHQDGRLSVDLFGDLDPGRNATKLAEEQAEDLRLLYVAATRAQSRVLAWWAATRRTTDSSPLHRLLADAGAPGQPPPASYPGGRDPQRWRLDRSRVEVLSIPRPSGAPRAPLQDAPEPELAARVFHDHIDRDWARTSYSRLTANAHLAAPPVDSGVGSEDEPDLDSAPLAPTPRPDPPHDATPLSGLPGGTQFGSLVHGVLEQVDPSSPSLGEDLEATGRQLLARWPVTGVEPGPLADGLGVVLSTSLGELSGGRSLSQLGAANRLAELEFELPLGSPDRRGTVGDLAALWSDPGLVPTDDPLAGYGRVLADSPAAPAVLAGFLTGSIDALLRVPSGDRPWQGQPIDSAAARYVVVDYKTNRLPTAPGESLGPHCYTQQAMVSAMMAAHYPLQALLYCVATHRYLRWRLPGYRPEDHLGGVGYLFVRGMPGSLPAPGCPAGAGVFTWHPSVALVEAASQVLAGSVRP